MIICKELGNKEFATKREMFVELKANKDKIIGLKKASFKNSDYLSVHLKGKGANKSAGDEAIGIGSTIYAVINTTNFYDSHGDVHLDGIWDVSVKDNKGKLYYIINHELEIGKVIAYPQDVEASVQILDWQELGLPYTGSTQALIFKVLLTDASNQAALGAISRKAALQNSVRMAYITMILCVDDQSEDMTEEYANFHKYLPLIANKQDAIDAGYYWAIPQAKIVKEGSACLFGSNEATPILYADPANTSQKLNDPSDDSQDDEDTEIEDCTDDLDLSQLLNIF
jgi:hypothetical protein